MLFPLVFTPGGRIGPSAELFLRRLARERASIFLPPGDEPSPGALHAIYRHYRRRLAHALARGLALQIAIYGLERRARRPPVGRCSPCCLSLPHHPLPWLHPRASLVNRPLVPCSLIPPQGERAGRRGASNEAAEALRATSDIR